MKRLILLLALLIPLESGATDVSLAGTFGQKAVLIIDNGPPRTVSIGQTTREGILLLSVENGSAVLEIDGKRKRIRMGERIIQQAGSTQNEMILHGDSQGHFVTSGRINNHTIQFLVDTGASFIAIGRPDAQRLGINYENAPMAMASTANGMVRFWRVRVDKLEIGPFVMYDMEAAVLERDMQPALLGMTFLNRMDMVREGNSLKLKQRY